MPARPARWLPWALCALALLTTGARAEEIRMGGTGAGLGTLRLLAEAYARQQSADTVQVLPSLGSGGGMKALLAGAVQVAVIARPLQDKESQAGAVAVEIGRTPFVFASHAATKARSLSTQNLVDIYAGRLDQWPEGLPIRLVLRPVGDTDSETIKAISPAMREAKSAAEQRKGMLFAVTDQDAADTLEKTPGSFGPATLALILTERRALKVLALDGVTPEPRTLADGSYPHAKPMLLVTGPRSTPAAQAFVAFARSPVARELLARNGYWVK